MIDANFLDVYGDRHRAKEFQGFWVVQRLGMIYLEPWRVITDKAEIKNLSDGINQRYPNRTVTAFARRQDTDDVACLVQQGMAKLILVIHDFADPGWEISESFDDFWVWYSQAINEFIEIQREVHPN
jgi:hypothetical protein